MAGNREGLRRWFQAAFVWGMFAAVAAAHGAEPVLVLQVPPGPVSAPAGMTATAYFLNPGAEALPFVPPSRIPWRLVGETPSAGAAPVEGSGSFDLEPPSGGAPGMEVAREIGPGGFATREYRSAVPPGGAGGRLIEVPLAGNARFQVLVVGADEARAGRETGADAGGRGTGDPGVEPPDITPVGGRELPGQRFFRRHFAGYEPIYFVYGPDSPNAKFQVSLRYKILDPDAEPGRWWAWTHGLHLAYSQTSLWDFAQPSAPFYDSSYKPELLWRVDDLFRGAVSWWEQLGLQAGAQHESNGKDGPDSRSLNLVYLRPTFVFGSPTNLFLAVSPRVWAYAGDLSDNPDIADYRGHGDLVLKAGWARSLQLAGAFRVGDDFDRGSMQLDLTYPTGRWLGSFDLFLHAQYFNGWGESLLDYDQRSWTFRFGISLFR